MELSCSTNYDRIALPVIKIFIVVYMPAGAHKNNTLTKVIVVYDVSVPPC